MYVDILIGRAAVAVETSFSEYCRVVTIGGVAVNVF